MQRIQELDERYIASTYRRQPLALVKGRGMFVEDIQGKRYLDFVGGIAVCSLGHCHPALVKAISAQAKKLMHISNLYYIQQQAELAALLARVVPKGINKFFFCNSGAEAIEGAFKLAIKHTKRQRIIAMQGSFHGRTAASVGATWKSSYREPFGALIPQIFDFVPFNDLAAVERAMGEQTAAVIVEAIQGESGINVPSNDYLPGLRKLCDEYEVLLICDEVQTGVGRTGKWFACEHWNVEPDELTMAKALGGGFPIGCLGARAEVMESFSPGDHASTFGGNPLACAAAKTVIKTMMKLKLPQRATKIGEYFKKRLNELADKHGCVREVRGLGLMLAMELSTKQIADAAVVKARKRGFLINCTADKVLRFIPPLIVERKHIDRLIEALDVIFVEVEK
ncbi:Acetylornithine aminotransferase [subsurface metagenome]|nr:acetylornithine/succinylornithine family transaminase [Hadesarchaea archaeon]TES83637.1 MAG: aspartate aminotransferase family protein [Hadesarchaea archaeon]